MSLARDASGGILARELWRYEKSFVAVVPSPLVLDGLVYTIKNGGILTVLRTDTGEVVRTGRVGSAPSSCSAPPSRRAAESTSPTRTVIVAVVRAGKDWELLASNDLGEPLFATPALSEGRIYVRGQKSLFSFAAKSSPAHSFLPQGNHRIDVRGAACGNERRPVLPPPEESGRRRQPS